MAAKTNNQKSDAKEKPPLKLGVTEENVESRNLRKQQLIQSKKNKQNQQQEQRTEQNNNNKRSTEEAQNVTKKQKTSGDNVGIQKPTAIQTVDADGATATVIPQVNADGATATAVKEVGAGGATGTVDPEVLTPGDGEQDTVFNEDFYHLNTDMDVESDEGLVLETLDPIAKSPTGLPVDHALCTPAEIRECLSVLRRIKKGKTYKSPKKKRDEILAQTRGVTMITLKDYGGFQAVKAKFSGDYDSVVHDIDLAVTQCVYKHHKFPMSTHKEKSIVLDLVEKGKVKWENKGATDTEVALCFHECVGKKIGLMRQRSAQLAHLNFKNDGKYKDRRPANLLKKLDVHYRQYFDRNKKLKPGMKPFWDAFCYFAMRILPAVNASQTKFGEKQKHNRMTLLLSDVFSVSDEAFALVMVVNYYRRWVLLERYEPKEGQKDDGKTFWRQSQFDAQFSGSAQGRKDQGWNDEGISKYNYLCNLVKERRTGTPNKPDVVDEMFRKRFAASLGFVIDDSAGPIGATDAGNNNDEPNNVVEVWCEEEQQENLDRLCTKLSQKV